MGDKTFYFLLKKKNSLEKNKALWNSYDTKIRNVYAWNQWRFIM